MFSNSLIGDPLSPYVNFDEFFTQNEKLLSNLRAILEDRIVERDYDDKDDYALTIATGVAAMCVGVQDSEEQSDEFYEFVRQLHVFFVLIDLEHKQLIKRVIQTNGTFKWALADLTPA